MFRFLSRLFLAKPISSSCPQLLASSDLRKVITVTGTATPDEMICPTPSGTELYSHLRDGPSALEFNLASLILCKNFMIRLIAKREKIEVGNISWEAHGDIDYTGLLKGTQPSHWDGVRVSFEIETEASEEKLEEIVQKLHVVCPVESLFLAADVPLETEYKILEV